VGVTAHVMLPFFLRIPPRSVPLQESIHLCTYVLYTYRTHPLSLSLSLSLYLSLSRSLSLICHA
jgi:hypothetical protein